MSNLRILKESENGVELRIGTQNEIMKKKWIIQIPLLYFWIFDKYCPWFGNFSEKAFDEDGKLKQPKQLSINKVGHGMDFIYQLDL